MGPHVCVADPQLSLLPLGPKILPTLLITPVWGVSSAHHAEQPLLWFLSLPGAFVTLHCPAAEAPHIPRTPVLRRPRGGTGVSGSERKVAYCHEGQNKTKEADPKP